MATQTITFDSEKAYTIREIIELLGVNLVEAKAKEKEEYYSTKEVAEMLGVTTTSVLNYISRGELGATKLSPRSYRISKAQLERFMSGRR